MPDVVQYVIAATGDIKNGRVVVGANKLGSYSAVNPKIDKDVVAAQSGILDARFDDKTYYSA